MKKDNNEGKKNKIIESLDKLIYDFIPELEGQKFSHEFKKKIVEGALNEVDPNKIKLVLALPNPILADYVCKNSLGIVEEYNKES